MSAERLSPLQKLRRKFHSSLILRAMLIVIGTACIIGTLAVGGSYIALKHREQQRLYAGLNELMSATQGSASVAAFARDNTLAREVALGLLANPAVARVEIRNDDDSLLAEAHQPGLELKHREAPLRHVLSSPFNPESEIGMLLLFPRTDLVQATAASSSAIIALLLGLELLGVACAVGWLVFTRVARPIGVLADNMHTLRLDLGGMLWPPPGNERDEIGRLVGDMNHFIAHLQNLLLSERELREAVALSEHRYRLIFENTEAGIFMLDEIGRMISWNPAFERILGKNAAPARGEKPLLASLLGSSPVQVETLILRALHENHTVKFDINCRHADSDCEHLHIVMTPIEGGMLQGVCNDITERKRNELRSRALAERDPLTGLLNRRGFESRAEEILSHLSHNLGVAILMLDLDGFKQVNDTLGHEAGDDVLRHVARLLENNVRRADLLARPGGDEFVILLGELQSLEPATMVASKIITALETPVMTRQGQTASIGTSIGIATSFDGHDSVEALLRRADQAMYAVKRSGKNSFRFAETPSA